MVTIDTLKEFTQALGRVSINRKSKDLTWCRISSTEDLISRAKNVDVDHKTALMYACFLNYQEIVFLLVTESDVTAIDCRGMTALMHACANGSIESVEVLMHSNMLYGIDCTDYYENTALMHAASSNNFHVVNYMLDFYPDASIPDETGLTCLMHACIYQNEYSVTKLLIWSDVYSEDDDGNTAMMHACKKESLYIIKHVKCPVNRPNHVGKTCLMFACQRGILENVKYLVEDSDVASRDKMGKTALMYCFSANNLELIHLVSKGVVKFVDTLNATALMYALDAAAGIDIIDYLAQKSHVNAVDSHLRTALMRACRKGYPRIVKHLTSISNLSVWDDKGNSALDYACIHVNIEIDDLNLDLLLENKNKEGKTCLATACFAGNLYAVEKLLSLGANVNSKTKKGLSCLSLACINGTPEVVRALCKVAKVRAKDKWKNSSLMHACSNSNFDAASIILRRSDVKSINSLGQTVLMSACNSGSIELVDLIMPRSDVYRHELFEKIGNEMVLVDLLLPLPDGSSRELYTKNDASFVSFKLQHSTNCDVPDIFSKDSAGNMKLLNVIHSHGYDNEDVYKKKIKGRVFLTSLSSLRTVINRQDSFGKSAFMYACENGSIPLVNKLIASKKFDLFAVDRFGHNALVQVCEHGSYELASVLADVIDVNKLSPCDGVSALMKACGSRKGTKFIKMLLDHGAKLKCQDNDGRTPLIHACKGFKASTEIIKLIAYKSDVRAIDCTGKNALMYARQHSNVKVISILKDLIAFRTQTERGVKMHRCRVELKNLKRNTISAD